MDHNKIKGLIAAPYTPFTPDCKLNLSAVSPYAERLKNNNISGVFVGGTTGEGMLLTVDERKLLTEAWALHRSPNFKFMVHVGATSYKDAITLTGHAAAHGADAIGAMGPLFLKPAGIPDLVAYCKTVAAAAPDLPFYYYHIPDISGVDLSMPDFLEQAEAEIPNLKGIKFTHANLMNMFVCMRGKHRKWDILHGQDETLLAGLSLGAEGAVGSTYNYASALYRPILEAFAGNDLEEARKWQELSARFIRILIRYGGGVIGGKPLMKITGIDCGPLRTPARNLTEKELIAFERTLKKEGILKYFDGFGS
ncbi:dihydrodipicolinate synthase family protein [Sinomicrobium soli]|uniref:dihydrodipicolinate synthase family protein n=1 Tax=Sinomicrobium sp. N-1-3-6 TaxID=2219864 RepID=UPI000DCE3D11|nr:dihydrodipicolinate synthase family protein [Sinomicrobium sp. N-1-3-6]RAV29538.1 hypothetical protein DN748_08575 [Sinomicrobium sp. N-1-3-6]